MADDGDKEDGNKENIPPPPPLIRQVASDLREPPIVHGQSDLSPPPLTLDYYDQIAWNNGLRVPEGEYEEEELTDDSDSDEEGDDEEMINEIVNNAF